LEKKGLLRHRREGTRYIYRPRQAKESVSRCALSHLIKKFFAGSAPDTVAAILDISSDKLSDDDLNRIERPNRKVATVEYISAGTRAAPFCAAITVEEPES
jgi:predicted transcriptional regulator